MNDFSAIYIEILKKAANDELPDRINDDSVVPLSKFRELHKDGFVNAINASSHSGEAFLNPSISVAGREYLRLLEGREYDKSARAKLSKIGLRTIDWVIGIAAGLLIAWGTKLFEK